MQVILMERIEKLGQMGEVVTVKPGYARNYLLPQGKARRATKENFALFTAAKWAVVRVSDHRFFCPVASCYNAANRRTCESGYPRCNFYPRHVKRSYPRIMYKKTVEPYHSWQGATHHHGIADQFAPAHY